MVDTAEQIGSVLLPREHLTAKFGLSMLAMTSGNRFQMFKAFALLAKASSLYRPRRTTASWGSRYSGIEDSTGKFLEPSE